MTYSVRCRNSACRHRRVTKIHPADYKLIPRCTACGERKGWRLESRDYNKKDLCGCGQSPLYPHRKGKYPCCDFHPNGAYNQAKRRGVEDKDIPFEEIPLDLLGKKMHDDDDDECPF